MVTSKQKVRKSTNRPEEGRKKEDSVMSFGAQLKQARKRKKMTQKQLADTMFHSNDIQHFGQ